MTARLIDELIRLRVLKESQRIVITEEQAKRGGAIDTTILELGLASENQLLPALRSAYGFACADPSDATKGINENLFRRFPEQLAIKHGWAPLQFCKNETTLQVLCTAPPKLKSLREVGSVLDLVLKPVLSTEVRVEQRQALLYQRQPKERFMKLLRSSGGLGNESIQAPRLEKDEQPSSLRPNQALTFADATRQLLEASTRDEVVDIALSYIHRRFCYVALFAARQSRLHGWKSVGCPGQDIDQIRIDPTHASSFSAAFETGAQVLGPPQSEDLPYLKRMGRQDSRSILLVPMRMGEQVFALFYADQGSAAISPHLAAETMVFAHHVQQAMARIVLKQRETPLDDGEVDNWQCQIDAAVGGDSGDKETKLPKQAPHSFSDLPPFVLPVKKRETPIGPGPSVSLGQDPTLSQTPEPFPEPRMGSSPLLQSAPVLEFSEKIEASDYQLRQVVFDAPDSASLERAQEASVVFDVQRSFQTENKEVETTVVPPLLSEPPVDPVIKKAEIRAAPLTASLVDSERDQLDRGRMLGDETVAGDDVAPFIEPPAMVPKLDENTPEPSLDPEEEEEEEAIEVQPRPASFVAQPPVQYNDEDYANWVQALNSPDPLGRQHALDSDIAQDEAVLPLIRPFFPGVLNVDPASAGATLPRFSKCGSLLQVLAQFGPTAHPYVEGFIDSSEMKERFFASYFYSEVQVPIIIPRLIRRLHDGDPRVSTAAINSLKQYQNDPAFEMVVLHLHDRLKGNSIPAQKKAIECLGLFKDVRAVEALIDIIDRQDKNTLNYALLALEEITRQSWGLNARKWKSWWQKHRQQSRTEWLVQALESKDPSVREKAIKELEAISGERKNFEPHAKRRPRSRAVADWKKWIKTR